MTPRELFESRFPVPENVSWAGDSCYSIINRQLSDAEWDVARIDAALHTSKWIGFQAGYEAGREGK